MKSRRRRAREVAFQALYQAEHGQDSAEEAVEQILSERRAGPDVAEYARRLVRIFSAYPSDIDAAILESLDRWKLERLAAVDRNILRVAAAELLHATDVPAEVVINEAVDIAKKYSTENSGAFVNGVLDHLWRVSGGGAVREGRD
jgi:transcription antitermination factor NusB